MSETYRKQGSVVRWENGTLVHVAESGVAVESGELFTCQPERSAQASPSIDTEDIVETAARITAIGVTIERLIVSHGATMHQFRKQTWSEESRRIHLSMVHGRIRILIDLGTFDLADVETAAAALARSTDEERPVPPRLRLAPNVSAALLPSLAGLTPPNAELWQTGGGVDGKGEPIEETRIDAPPWPNWFRPTYRIRPMRMPLNVRLRCNVTAIERDRPRAVALLAPVEGLVARVLVDDGRAAYPVTLRVSRIDAVAEDAIWYPYGGGSFGAEMML